MSNEQEDREKSPDIEKSQEHREKSQGIEKSHAVIREEDTDTGGQCERLKQDHQADNLCEADSGSDEHSENVLDNGSGNMDVDNLSGGVDVGHLTRHMSVDNVSRDVAVDRKSGKKDVDVSRNAAVDDMSVGVIGDNMSLGVHVDVSGNMNVDVTRKTDGDNLSGNMNADVSGKSNVDNMSRNMDVDASGKSNVDNMSRNMDVDASGKSNVDNMSRNMDVDASGKSNVDNMSRNMDVDASVNLDVDSVTGNVNADVFGKMNVDNVSGNANDTYDSNIINSLCEDSSAMLHDASKTGCDHTDDAEDDDTLIPVEEKPVATRDVRAMAETRLPCVFPGQHSLGVWYRVKAVSGNSIVVAWREGEDNHPRSSFAIRLKEAELQRSARVFYIKPPLPQQVVQIQGLQPATNYGIQFRNRDKWRPGTYTTAIHCRTTPGTPPHRDGPWAFGLTIENNDRSDEENEDINNNEHISNTNNKATQTFLPDFYATKYIDGDNQCSRL
jgi:hypothetical protein